eukprot:153093_1
MLKIPSWSLEGMVLLVAVFVRKQCHDHIMSSVSVVLVVQRFGRMNHGQKKVEWYSADALNIDSFKSYITNQKPVAIFTMMGTLNVYKQFAASPQWIFEYAGTTNINVCNVADSIESVKTFVYIGANVESIGVRPDNENNPFALWTSFMLGQYNAKTAVEKCVDAKFGDHGITFRPTLIAGKERVSLFGNMFEQDAEESGSWFEFNRLPCYDVSVMRKFYKFMFGDLVMDVRDLAKDSLDFIEDGKVDKLKSPHHSKRPQVPMAEWKVMVLHNADNILWGLISGGAMLLYSLISRWCC